MGPSQPLIQWVPGLSRVVNRPGRGVDHPSPSSAEVKERAIPLLPHWTFVACYRFNFTFTFTFTLSFRAFFLPSEARPGSTSSSLLTRMQWTCTAWVEAFNTRYRQSVENIQIVLKTWYSYQCTTLPLAAVC